MERVDVAVVGGGQSGLATAHALRQHGLRPVALEQSDHATGSWLRYYDSLTLFSPARYSSLPGMPFPGSYRDRHPRRDEVAAYLSAYAAQLDADIRTGQRVTAVQQTGRNFDVELEGGDRLATQAVVAARAPSDTRTIRRCRAWRASVARCCTLPTTGTRTRSRVSAWSWWGRETLQYR